MEAMQNNGFPACLNPEEKLDFAVLRPLLERLQSDPSIHILVLDGPCGSGKTTLAALLGKRFDLTPIAMDDFFLPPPLRTPERLQTPGGNIHWERFAQQVLLPLQKGQDHFHYEAFCCQNGSFAEKSHSCGGLTLIEGSYSHHPAFWEAYGQLHALKVFLSVSEEEQLRRLKKRNEERFPQFLNRWIPLEKNYFRAYDIEGRAELVLHSLPYDENGTGKEE